MYRKAHRVIETDEEESLPPDFEEPADAERDNIDADRIKPIQAPGRSPRIAEDNDDW